MTRGSGSIRAVIFDYGGVLMRTVDPRPRRELERELGMEPFGADRLVFGHPLWDQAQLGNITSDEFWEAVAERLGVGAEGLADFQRRFWSGDRLDADLVGLLKDLRGRGYLLGLLSNNPGSLRQRIDELLPGVFDSFVISGLDGVMKPDPAIYRLSVDRLGVQLGEAAFVDDYESNVVGAREAGLEAVHFRGLAPLRRDLRALGVTVADPAISPVAGIQAVILDWGGVLEGLPDQAHFESWGRRLGVSSSTLRNVLWGQDYRQPEVGGIGADEFARRVAGNLGLPSAEAAREFLREFYSDHRLDPQTPALLRALRGRYKVGLLTNAFPGHAEWVRSQYGLDVYAEFDVYVNSAEVGLRKPDPAIFELVLDRLGCRPEQAVCVDDGLRNVDAARAVGMHAIQYVGPVSSLRELEALLGHSLPGPRR
jgi:HAD superfamily hydrolase (TIGR01509 family)